MTSDVAGPVEAVLTEQPQITHGTLTAYTNHRCRCDVCRLFWNAYMRWWRVEQRGRLHSCPTCSCPTPIRPGEQP